MKMLAGFCGGAAGSVVERFYCPLHIFEEHVGHVAGEAFLAAYPLDDEIFAIRRHRVGGH